MSNYQIKIRIPFRAGHRLIEPYKGKCNNVHGEGFTAIVYLKSEFLNESGMVEDFGFVKKLIKNWIDENWDHAYIHHQNDFIGDFLIKNDLKVFNIGKINPTSETLARYLFMIIKRKISDKVFKVGIVESFEDSIAYYEEGDDDDD